MEELIKIVAQIAEQENQQPGHICIECSSNKKISPEIRYQTMLCICDTFLLSLIKEAKMLGTELDPKMCYEHFASDLLNRCGNNTIRIEV